LAAIDSLRTAAGHPGPPRQHSLPYLGSDEWRGKAGGYAIQGLAGAFVAGIVGSYTNVVGLPVYETVQLLAGLGYPVQTVWAGETSAACGEKEVNEMEADGR
jgi:hypothetical protein